MFKLYIRVTFQTFLVLEEQLAQFLLVHLKWLKPDFSLPTQDFQLAMALRVTTSLSKAKRQDLNLRLARPKAVSEIIVHYQQDLALYKMCPLNIM